MKYVGRELKTKEGMERKKGMEEMEENGTNWKEMQEKWNRMEEME